MGFVRMDDLAQVMMATGGGGGGGMTMARQATQARGYVMPGSTPPISQPTVSIAAPTPVMSAPQIVSAPMPQPASAPRPTAGPPPPPPPPPPPGGPPPSPTFTAVPDTFYAPHTIVYIEGASDPYNEFANSSVDEGSEAQSLEPESKSEYIDPFEQKKPENKGPFNVFKIEDDPTLTDLADLTPQEKQAIEDLREADRLAGVLVGAAAGVGLGIGLCKLWSWWRRS